MQKFILEKNLETISYECFCWSWFSILDAHSRTIKRLTQLTNCREYHTLHYRKNFWIMPRRPQVLVHKGFHRDENYRTKSLIKLIDDMTRSLYFLNRIEDHHGLRRSRLFEVELPADTGVSPTLAFIGPRQWMISPFMSSLYTLIIGTGKEKWFPRLDPEMSYYDTMEKVYKHSGLGSNSFANQVRTTIKNWDFVIRRRKELFSTSNRFSNWDFANFAHLEGYDSRPEGIQRLIQGKTKHIGMIKRYQSVLRRDKILGNYRNIKGE